MYNDKSLLWLRKSIKQDYKILKVLKKRLHDGTDDEVKLFIKLMHMLTDQIKTKEYIYDERLGL